VEPDSGDWRGPVVPRTVRRIAPKADGLPRLAAARAQLAAISDQGDQDSACGGTGGGLRPVWTHREHKAGVISCARAAVERLQETPAKGLSGEGRIWNWRSLSAKHVRTAKQSRRSCEASRLLDEKCDAAPERGPAHLNISTLWWELYEEMISFQFGRKENASDCAPHQCGNVLRLRSSSGQLAAPEFNPPRLLPPFLPVG